MKKILIFILFLIFAIPLYAAAQDGVIMLSSPEEIEQFKKLLEDKTLIAQEEEAVSVEVSSDAVSAVPVSAPVVETSYDPVKDVQPVTIQSQTAQQQVLPQDAGLAPVEPGGIIILQSEEEISAFNEKISTLVSETYGTGQNGPEIQQK